MSYRQVHQALSPEVYSDHQQRVHNRVVSFCST